MKHWVIALMILVLLLSGCSKEAPPAAEVDDEPQVVQKEKVPAIVSADAPKRDPFASVSGSSRTELAGSVPTEGRDPFTVGKTGDQWETQEGKVSKAGRNPFVEGTGKEEPLPPPPVEEPPDKPEVPGEEPPVVGDGVVIKVTTLDRCWLDVFVDQQRVLRTNVPVGETLSWRGEQEVLLDQVGRERAIEITVNGQQLGVLSELVKELKDGPKVVAGVQVSLKRTYPGGVLAGLSFRNRE